VSTVKVFDDAASYVHVLYGILTGLFFKHYLLLFAMFCFYQLTTHTDKPHEHRMHALLGDFVEFAWGLMFGLLVGVSWTYG